MALNFGYGVAGSALQGLLDLTQRLPQRLLNCSRRILIISESFFGGVVEGVGRMGGVRFEWLGVLLPALDGVEEVFLAFGEGGVFKGDGVGAFGHFAEVVHIELRAKGNTCLRKDL